MRKYLVLDHNCFLWSNSTNGILYNSSCGDFFDFSCDSKIAEACEYLKNPDNLYTIEITPDKGVAEDLYSLWIKEVCLRGMGRLQGGFQDGTRPASLPPLLNILKDVNKLRTDKGDRNVGEDILTYFYELYIYLGGIYKSDANLHKQIDAPAPFADIFSPDELIRLIEKFRTPYLRKIHLIGNTLLNRNEFEQIIQLLDRSTSLTWILEGSNLLENNHKKKLSDLTGLKIDFCVVCNPQDNIPDIEAVFTECSFNYKFIIPVSSETDLTEADRNTTLLKNKNYQIKPFYTGKNINFFQKYVYTTEEDIRTSKLSKRQIFSHQAVNTNFFGKLIITPDRKVYANLNHPPLGDVTESIYDLVCKEMDTGISWRMIRKEKPCIDCLYRYLCQSPSNYELVINQPNLCMI